MRSILALQPRFSKVADMLAQAEPDLLAHIDFPTTHSRQLRSTNGLERLNREVARRKHVVGIFPHRDSVLRLTGALLAEQDDERTTSRRYFSVESMSPIRADTPRFPFNPEHALSAAAKGVALAG